MKHEEDWVRVLRWFTEYFSGLKLLELKDKDWDRLKVDLRAVLFPGTTNKPGSNYDLAFNHSDVGEAQRNVKGVLQRIAWRNKLVLKNDPNEHPNNLQQEHFPLRLPDAHRDVIGEDGKTLKWVKPLQLYVVIEPNADVWTFYDSINLPTIVYLSLRDALMLSGLTGSILTCDSRDCGKLFLSKRKPRQDRAGHYCTYKCCHLESTRRYREGPQDEPTKTAARAVERERVRRYYKPHGKVARGR